MIFGRINPKTTFLVMLGLACWLSSANAAPKSLDNLMQAFAKEKKLFASFKEEKLAFYLDEPLKSEGQLKFIAPDTLIKKTLKPELIIQEIKGKQLKVTDASGEVSSIDLSDHPPLASMFNALLSIFTGKIGKLDSDFHIEYLLNKEKWTIRLKPKTEEIAGWFKAINMQGKEQRLLKINIIEANNDSTLIVLYDHH